VRLILRQYLAALKERGELDAILPDLLSQMGLVVFSRPRRGTRQDGVDVAAFGRIDAGEERVFLFSVKAGDLTREEWNGNAAQALRPSLDEIADSFIPNRLPQEHKGKKCVICLVFGGDVREEIRANVTGYTKERKSDRIEFEEWNGDKLAELIEKHLLSESLLPIGVRDSLRKSLALLDQPEASHAHFGALLRSIAASAGVDKKARVRALRQVVLCLWVLIAWAREAKNLESAYRSSELALLLGWRLAYRAVKRRRKEHKDAEAAFEAIATAYFTVCEDFLRENVVGPACARHALSTAVRGNALDVNLKLFDVLGRLAVRGLWVARSLGIAAAEGDDVRDLRLDLDAVATILAEAIENNPALKLPVTEDQTTDVALAMSVLALSEATREYSTQWLKEVVARARYALRVGGPYPCVLSEYSELLEHPRNEPGYRERATAASVLYPMIAFFAAVLQDGELFESVARMQRDLLSHSTFQAWWPGESSEEAMLEGRRDHGVALTGIDLSRGAAALIALVESEAKARPYSESWSFVRAGWWPIFAVASRHGRVPPPIDMLQSVLSLSPRVAAPD